MRTFVSTNVLSLTQRRTIDAMMTAQMEALVEER